MLTHIFDSHAHYDADGFDGDRDRLLGEALPAAGVCGVVNMSCSLESCQATLELTRRYGYVYGAAGIHPEDAGSLPEGWLAQVESFLDQPKMVAVGEIGLDYYWPDGAPREVQRQVFAAQLELANRRGLPVSVHCREATAETLALLAQYRPRGVVHCFSGSWETAREILSLGMYLGLGGVVTFKNARHPVEVARQAPLDRLLLETDAPYLAPVPHRGKRNDSSLIPFTAERIAALREMPAQELLDQTAQNARRLFGIS